MKGLTATSGMFTRRQSKIARQSARSISRELGNACSMWSSRVIRKLLSVRMESLAFHSRQGTLSCIRTASQSLRPRPLSSQSLQIEFQHFLIQSVVARTCLLSSRSSLAWPNDQPRLRWSCDGKSSGYPSTTIWLPNCCQVGEMRHLLCHKSSGAITKLRSSEHLQHWHGWYL